MQEKNFGSYIRNLIQEYIIKKNDKLLMLESKDVVDIIICKNGDNPKIFFIELKTLTNTKNRIGIGNKNGYGFQIELLLKRPDYFEKNLKWILMNEENKIIVVDSKKLFQNYISGGKITKNQNNIRTNIFKNEKSLREDEIIEFLNLWFNS